MPNIIPQPKHAPESSIRMGFIIFGIVIVVAIVLRLVDWVLPSTQPPLLTPAEGLIRITDTARIVDYTDTSVALPNKTFGATLKVIGVYPDGAVSLVYVRDDFRFVEMSVRPNRTLADELLFYPNAQIQTLTLKEIGEVKLVEMRNASVCRKPRSENFIGVCQVTRALLFEKEGTVTILFADGSHPTDGELIEMARSLTNG